ncbi:hypothetical protein MTO96_003686 [Rhipicephalus appendiculatus]
MDDDEAQSKKPRLDENKFDDKTSTYDLSDEDDMGDDEPFTSAQKNMTTRSASQFFSPNVRIAQVITLPPIQAARKAKLLQKCAVMSLSMEENRAPMNPFQTLRLFIQYVIHLSGHRNKNSRETHQENRQEHIQETTQKKYVQAPRPTRQSCERP